MEKKRSIGIIIGIIIFGILFTSTGTLLSYLIGFPFLSCLFKERFNYSLFLNLGPAGRIADFENLLMIVIPIIMLIMGIGILLLKSWARKITLFIFVPLVFLYCLSLAYTYMKGEGLAYFPTGYIIFCGIAILSSILITSPVVIFFTRPKVKALFGPKTLE